MPAQHGRIGAMICVHSRLRAFLFSASIGCACMSRNLSENRLTGAVLLALLALMWLGMVLGVSFLATTAKFAAPTLSLNAALDVGRHTFRLFIHVELVFVAALALVALGFARDGLTWVMVALVAAIVGFEFVWLLPTLDQRVGTIVAGGTPAASNVHEIYIALEGIKAAILCTLGVRAVLSLPADASD